LLDTDSIRHISSFEAPVVFKGEGVTRLLLTRNDVLHSLGVPSLGLKLDSIPGRLNRIILKIPSKGFYVGSCYELCGRGHRVIPLSFFVN
jgi:cytochrome c oxidase subunit 2